MARISEPISPEQLAVVAAEASWDDLEALVGLGGHCGTTTHSGHLPGPSKKDRDWNDSRFVLVDHLRPHRVEEETYPAYCSWATMSESLERELAG